VNLAILRGALSSAPELRTLASGDVLAQLQITTREPDSSARTVPVAWFGPPAWIDRLDVGDDVVVLGAVHRRFFRAGGATASRVEVVAERVVRGGDRRAIERVVAVARARLE
jgi:single-strand DNA-binding protein